MTSFRMNAVMVAGLMSVAVVSTAAYAPGGGAKWENHITIAEAYEGLPQRLVTAMKADEGVPQNLVTDKA